MRANELNMAALVHQVLCSVAHCRDAKVLAKHLHNVVTKLGWPTSLKRRVVLAKPPLTRPYDLFFDGSQWAIFEIAATTLEDAPALVAALCDVCFQEALLLDDFKYLGFNCEGDGDASSHVDRIVSFWSRQYR
jgi:hypothetical protein